jgi:hypothetical protein
MKINLFGFIITINILLAIACAILFHLWRKDVGRADSLESLIKEKNNKAVIFTDKSGNEHLKEEPAIISDHRTLKDDPEFMELISLVKGLKTKNVESISSTGIHSEYHIETTLRDSTVHDTVRHECLNYDNKFISAHGCDGKYDFKTNDSIAELVYWQRKKILFLKIGKKKYEREIINFNPNSHFSYSREVIFKKR